MSHHLVFIFLICKEGTINKMPFDCFSFYVEAARDAIDVANAKAEGFPHGLGIVKTMGRNIGFIAMH